MYVRALNVRHGEAFYSMAGTLRAIMFGEVPPIPKNILDMGMEEAERLRKELENQPKKMKKPEDKILIGGGIFTF